ncbi:MarR family winged helix-turn-helix transcriptional regulator [Rhodococcus sp. NPDC060090]|uniref:MarR family winged helix-turn-helix transcriptional regulator n=1 Tax=Rhodococcus sp. NPDC060090 TaxID=3347056 RepID=UPI003651020C
MSGDSFDSDEVNRLRIALGRIARRVSRPAGEGSLTPSQASLLSTVARRKTVGVRELADLEGLNPTMCSRMLGKLEDAGLVSRSADTDDKRVVLAYITTDGAALAETLRIRRTALFTEHLTELSEHHVDALYDALPALEALADSMGCGRNEART